MNFEEIRTRVVTALFSDEVLCEYLVLKGGNALELVHKVISRGSMDIDCSIEGDFSDLPDIKKRIFSSLDRTFAAHGLRVFDKRFTVVPPIRGDDPIPWWGGYVIEFKLIEAERFAINENSLAKMQRESVPIAPDQSRTFRIDISKHEYCHDKVSHLLAGQMIFVYSEEMCVFEKYRSLCQQMPEYQQALGKGAHMRGRDFYDIYATITRRGLDISLQENLQLCSTIFEAKRVPLELLAHLDKAREFHRPDWDAVRLTVAGNVHEFDFYFDFVVEEAEKLKSLWDK